MFEFRLLDFAHDDGHGHLDFDFRVGSPHRHLDPFRCHLSALKEEIQRLLT